MVRPDSGRGFFWGSHGIMFKFRPACFETAEQWEAWRQYNALSSGPVSPCHDCTPAYQRQMLAARRCEQPTVIFVVRDGAMMGVLPHEAHGTDERYCDDQD